MSRRAAALLLVLLLAGCNRQPPRFVSAEADTTGVSSADSFAVMVGRALDAWESGGGAAAAATTARVMLGDLRRHPGASLAERARTLLDSCGFSGEVAGAGGVAAANLFARSDPGGGAWPHLFWRDGAAVRSQELDGSGMRLVDLAHRPGQGRARDGDAGGQVALLFSRSSGRGQQPVVLTWRRPAGADDWTLVQSLGPDSLGGVGSAQFVPGPDGPQLEARTWRPNPGFDECASCPHVIRTQRFVWTHEGFARRSAETTPSPYATFVGLITALRAGDRELAMRRLADPSLIEAAERHEWGSGAGPWRVAPGADESSGELVFYRGNREAYQVRFASRGGEWLVTDLHPVERTID